MPTTLEPNWRVWARRGPERDAIGVDNEPDRPERQRRLRARIREDSSCTWS